MILLYLGFVTTLALFADTVTDPDPFWAIMNGAHALLCAVLIVKEAR